MLNAFYDLSVSPVKYDFVGFLLSVEHHRILTGENQVRIIFVPTVDGGFRIDKLPPYGNEKRRNMLINIVLPMCGMLGYPVDVVVCAEREQAKPFLTETIFPTQYTLKTPIPHYGHQTIARAFNNGFYPLVARKPIPRMNDTITISLRESHYWPSRNGNRKTWLKAAEMIKDFGLKPLFIPDVDSEPVEGFESNTEASSSLNTRAALYDASAHNLFVNNGVAWLAAAMKTANCTIFNMVAEGAPCCSPSFFESVGFPVGSQIGRDNHKIVWEPDSEEAVLPEVESIIKRVLDDKR